MDAPPEQDETMGTNEGTRLRKGFTDGFFRAVFSRQPYCRILSQMLVPEADSTGEIEDITLRDDGMTNRIRNDLGLRLSDGSLLLVDMQRYVDPHMATRMAMYDMKTRLHYYDEARRSNRPLEQPVPPMTMFVLYCGVRPPSDQLKWSRDSVQNRRTCEEFIIRTLDVSEMYDRWRKARDDGEDAESNVLIDYVRVVKILESMMSQYGDDKHKAMRALIQQCKAENLFVDVMDYLIMECGDDMDSFYDYYDPEREAYYIRLETEAVVTERLTRQFEEETEDLRKKAEEAEELRKKAEEAEELRRKLEEEVRRNNVEKASHFISKGYDDKLVSEISDLPVEEVRRIRESQGKERANHSSHSLVLTRSISITDMSLT